MFDSVRPYRRQLTRLLRPWDSPGKNTGVGCMKVKSESEVAQSCLTLSDLMDCSLPGSSVHGIFPGKSAGVGCHCLLWLKYIVTHQNSSLHCDSALSCKRMEIILKTGTLLKNTPTCSISRLSPFLCVSLYCRWIIFSKPI